MAHFQAVQRTLFLEPGPVLMGLCHTRFGLPLLGLPHHSTTQCRWSYDWHQLVVHGHRTGVGTVLPTASSGSK